MGSLVLLLENCQPHNITENNHIITRWRFDVSRLQCHFSFFLNHHKEDCILSVYPSVRSMDGPYRSYLPQSQVGSATTRVLFTYFTFLESSIIEAGRQGN